LSTTKSNGEAVLDDDASNAAPHFSNWRIWLLLACLVLLGWLWGDASPAASQSPPDPALTVVGSGGLAVPGGEVTYYIQLLNWTDGIIPDGVITHTLPSGFSYVPGSTQVTVGGWPITQTNPITQGTTLTWGPFQLPAAGHTAHNPYGAHTFVQDLCLPQFIDFQLDQALALVGSGGYVTQLFYRITPQTTGPDPCAVYFVNAAYDRNLVPILRLQGVWNPAGFWEKPDPGPTGDYAGIAAAFARYVEGLPRRNTHPLYVTVWNEPDLWIEWSSTPNACEYGRFFVAVSNAIRGLNHPGIRILNGAVTPANTAFIRQLLAVPGFITAFDAWASHCYPYNHPPWYNIHQRTARYGNTVIDCYIEERDAIARYGGRIGFKFVLTETGHGLGDNLYAFEGFPRINEANRASYIASAFHNYWRTWPEIIAVTPFELGDPWSGWEWLDWVDYRVGLDPFHFSMTPHPQYNAVAVLTKPHGATLPHGVDVTFRARVADDLRPGTYTSQLYGSAALRTTTVLTQAAPVQVVAHLERIHLPVIRASRNQDVWYMQVPPDNSVPHPSQEDVAGTPPAEYSQGAEYPQGSKWEGAIVPTDFLTGAASVAPGPGKGQGQAVLPARQFFDGAEPYLLVLDGRGGRAYIGLSGGGLAVLNVSTLEVEKRIRLGFDLETVTPGPDTGTVYGALSSGQVVLIDVVRGEVIARAGGLGRPRGMVFDSSTGSLLVADAQEGTIVRLSRDMSAHLAAGALDDLPDQILLDSASRRLYVTLPGARRVLALDADTLQPLAEAELVGGPLIDMAFDAAQGRIYVLSALSPQYRGLSVLKANDLSSLALVAGGLAVPLKQATALAISPDSHLLVAEGPHLYRISPEDFSVAILAQLGKQVRRGGLVADPATGRVFWIDPAGLSAAGGFENSTPASAAP
jgi:DNA-binding beta-propeller fold protein YncE